MTTIAVPAGAAGPGWPLWDSYTSYFADPQGRIIDRDAQDRTTSEAQAYALFFALVANDRGRFDQILQWTEENLAAGDLSQKLPAWLWGRAQDGSWRVLDNNSASDADLWMAYTLLQAGRLWKTPRYHALGLGLARQIAARELVSLPGRGPTLLPGPDGFRREQVFDCNPSYMTPQLMQGLAAAGAPGPWAAAASGAIKALQASSRKGFAFDWVEYRQGKGFQPTAGPTGKEPAGSFDAIRVYLWAGMLPPRWPGQKALLETFRPLAAYVRVNGAPPLVVRADGQAQGSGTIGFSAAVIPILQAMGESALARLQLERYNAALNPVHRLYGNPPRYYDQNLILFSEGWREQRFRFSDRGLLFVAWSR
jgi:endoglucanase